MERRELPPQAQLMNFIIGKWISKPIYVAAELGIADMLSDGPKNIEKIALLSQTHTPSLYRMMRALASVGIFSEIEEKQFTLTPMAELLKDGSMRSMALMFNSDWSDNAWGCFMDSIKTGETAFEKAHGLPVTEWLEENPSAGKVFNEANAKRAASFSRAIVEAYDFSEIKTLTDIGGGLGALITEILIANPSMNGVVADLPSVIRKTKEVIKSRGLENRCKTVECDFFENIPIDSDGYIMSNILHDWNDEQCHVILKNCHKVMEPESKLLIVEMTIPPGNQPSIAKLLDLEMLVTTGGRERTEAEFKTMLASSGFHFSKIIQTKAGICIIEGIRL